MPKPRTLRVLPNPYVFIDHEGRPHGSFDADPIQHDPNARKIGIKAIKATPIRLPSKGDDRPALHDVVLEYSDEVQTLPDGDAVHGPSLHARMGLKQGAVVEDVKDAKGAVTGRKIVLPGALVAADEETAKAVGLPFADPIELLAAAREAAIKQWTLDYGEPPAFATDPEAEKHIPPKLRGMKDAPTTARTTHKTTPSAVSVAPEGK